MLANSYIFDELYIATFMKLQFNKMSMHAHVNYLYTTVFDEIGNIIIGWKSVVKGW